MALKLIFVCVVSLLVAGSAIAQEQPSHNKVKSPAVSEIVGGAEDGDEVFPFFSLHLAMLASVFDRLPEMSWGTLHDELHVEGSIDGDDAWITVRKFPLQEQE